ncbi:hypothetical protein COY25_03980 [Candidatus Uhrbacteria bacterium CG_4_10_14_0_2_um_filter_41_7]|nr:MAG: hypothetical protein COY25_03980 [Candidatus Uhrbacteria bacterium CG_4_10_14_0_2_um_filter_41_7]
MRLAREKSPVYTTEATPLELGKAQIFREGSDVALIGCGPLVYQCLLAAEMLAEEGISACVVNNVSVKPMDEKTIIEVAKKCGAIVTIEEAQAVAGMGSAVCELLAEEYPVPISRMGMQDRFGESGEPDELLEHFKLTAPHIVLVAKKILKKKSIK